MVLSCHVFKFHMKNPILPCPFLVKKLNFVKTILYYGQEVNRMPFFHFFRNKYYPLHPHFIQTTSIFNKTLLSCPYFVKKTSILLKTQCSRIIFFNYFMENPCFHVHIWSKRRQFCQNYIKYWAKKVNTGALLLNFHEKKAALMPLLCQKMPFL